MAEPAHHIFHKKLRQPREITNNDRNHSFRGTDKGRQPLGASDRTARHSSSCTRPKNSRLLDSTRMYQSPALPRAPISLQKRTWIQRNNSRAPELPYRITAMTLSRTSYDLSRARRPRRQPAQPRCAREDPNARGAAHATSRVREITGRFIQDGRLTQRYA